MNALDGLRPVVSPLLLTLRVESACTLPGALAIPSAGPDATQVSFMGYAAGSSTQLRADAVAETVRLAHPDWTVNSMAFGGEARLIANRIAGEVHFLYTQSTRVLEFEVQQPLHPDIDFARAAAHRMVMPSSLLYVHFFAQRDAPIKTPRDIVNSHYAYRVGVGSGVSRLLLDKVLGYYGVGIDEAEAWGARHEAIVLASAEGAGALQSHYVDLAFDWMSVLNPQFTALDLELRLLLISDPGLVGMFESVGCAPTTIRGGAHAFAPQDVPTVAAPQHLAVRADMADDVVYEVLKAVYDHSDILFAAHAESRNWFSSDGVAAAVPAAERSGEQFHPGVLRFCRELGWIA